MRRTGPLTALPLLALMLVAGCADGSAAPAPTGVPSAPGSSAQGRSASAPSGMSSRTAPTSTPATAVGDPGDNGMLAGLGDQADWKSLVEPCPNTGQKPVIQKVVTADVTGDGTYDAVVARTCESSTAYWPSTVEVFDGTSQSKQPRRVGTLLTDVGKTDLPWATQVRVSGRTVTVEAYGVDAHTTQACPSIAYTYRYTYDGGSFRRVGRDVGNANTCPKIG